MNVLSRILVFLFICSSFNTIGACQKVTLAHEKPGPHGCGMRDPRGTAPPMLSVAQQKLKRERGTPKKVEKNQFGGLNWMYQVSRGSVFGEEETLETFSFDQDGILKNKQTDVLKRVGK